MNPFTFAFHELLFRPLFNLLVGITNLVPNQNVGLGIIIVTICVRILLLPFSLHQARQMQANQSKMAALQKDLKKIQDRYQNDAQRKAEETMKLYRSAGVNPASGCLPLLIQLPILIALYQVFLVGLSADTFSSLYSFIGQPESVQLIFFNVDLNNPSLLFGILAGLGQYFLMKRVATASPATPGSDRNAQMMASMQKNMAYIFPVMTIFIALQLPAALSLYWVVSTIFGILQQYFFKKYLHISSNVAV